MIGWTYILECSDGSYYTGSTTCVEDRYFKHQKGQAANYTKYRLPVKLVYLEKFDRIEDAFYREKQIQRWSRAKKIALINGWTGELKKLAACMNDTHFSNFNPASDNDDSGPVKERRKPRKERVNNSS